MRVLPWLLGAALLTAAHLTSPGPADAQTGSTRTEPSVVSLGSGCIRAGDPVQITGRGFGARPRGEIAIVIDGRAHALTVRNWSERRIRLDQPRGLAIEPGQSYLLRWTERNRLIAELGRVETCAAARRGPDTDADIRRTPQGVPEFIASVPQAAAGQAAVALQGLGATVLRTRDLAALGETAIVVTLPAGTSLADARAALSAAVPGATLDLHHLYRFVAGPRVYAAQMVTARDRACPLASPIAVGVIDGPLDMGHPALAGAKPRRRAFLPEGARPAPADHGTGVAALIAGGADAGPLAGFATGAQLHAAETFWVERGGDPASGVEWIAAALDWLLGDGVRLINLSFAGPENAALGRLVTAAARRGAILIAAVGNAGQRKADYPAASAEVIAVTAIDAAKRRYERANRDDRLDFAAPGVDIWSARAGTGGHYATGTSFASPIVAAAAAHHLASRPNLAADVIRALLRDDAVDLGAQGRDSAFGWGLVRIPGC